MSNSNNQIRKKANKTYAVVCPYFSASISELGGLFSSSSEDMIAKAANC
jgi:hypothetical protein